VSEDAAYYDRALRRLDKIAIAVAAAAVLFFAWRDGFNGAFACGVCAAGSVYNLRRLKAIAAGVGGGQSSGAPSAIGLGFRYLILGGACFVIIRFFEAGIAAIFAGLFVSVAAVVIEILYELVFSR
jgi:hypothetical protein